MEMVLKGSWAGTHSIDQHGDEHRDCNLVGVRWVLLSPDQLWVFGIEQEAEDAEYDNCKRRYDGAVSKLDGGPAIAKGASGQRVEGKRRTKTMLAWHQQQASSWTL